MEIAKEIGLALLKVIKVPFIVLWAILKRLPAFLEKLGKVLESISKAAP